MAKCGAIIQAGSKGKEPMQDLFYMFITVAFFAIGSAYARGCDKL